MKPNELMIGDYVIRKNVPNEILIVDTIDSIKDIVYLDLDGLGITEKLENIEPIPLTPEILKRNFPSTTDWYFIGTDKFCFRIDKYKDKWDLYFGKDGKGTNLQIKISYVHELQHALRLCGINKEIEI